MYNMYLELLEIKSTDTHSLEHSVLSKNITSDAVR